MNKKIYFADSICGGCKRISVAALQNNGSNITI